MRHLNRGKGWEPVDDYREVITTVLDVLAVLLVAFGAAALAFPFVGWGAALAGGLVVFVAVRAHELAARRKATVRR